MMRIAFILSFILSLACASYGQMQMSMRGGGKPIYYPFQLDSLFYWFDASDAATLQDSLGGAIANNEGVATWADKSGRNWDVTQGTNTARPVWKATGGPGSKPTIQFDGSNDRLISSDHLWTSDDLTIFVVYKMASATPPTVNFILSRYQSATNNRQFYFAFSGAAPGDPFEYRTSSDGTATSALNNDNYNPSAAFTLLGIVADGTTTGVTIYNDGSSVSGNTGSVTASMLNASKPFAIGADTNASAGNFLGGSISEIIVYSRALSDSERIGVEQYLKQKWGL